MNKKNNKFVYVGILILVFVLILGFTLNKHQSTDSSSRLTPTKTVSTHVNNQINEQNGNPQNNAGQSNNDQNGQQQYNNVQTTLNVDACDLSGTRVANAIVNVGVGNRQYIAYTNQDTQLIEVKAKRLILQNNSENTINGRYCKDEARVKGTESPIYDQGHVIADSLGGASNAYNITPQEANLNRHGAQAKMEKELREALHANLPVTDFDAKINYSDSKTTIPTSYSITVFVNNVKREYNFNNGSNANTNDGNTRNTQNSSTSSDSNTEHVGLHWGKNHHCYESGHAGSVSNSLCINANI